MNALPLRSRLSPVLRWHAVGSVLGGATAAGFAAWWERGMQCVVPVVGGPPPPPPPSPLWGGFICVGVMTVLFLLASPLLLPVLLAWRTMARRVAPALESSATVRWSALAATSALMPAGLALLDRAASRLLDGSFGAYGSTILRGDLSTYARSLAIAVAWLVGPRLLLPSLRGPLPR